MAEINVDKWLDKAAEAEEKALAGDETKWKTAYLCFKKGMSDDGTPMSDAEAQAFDKSLGVEV